MRRNRPGCSGGLVSTHHKLGVSLGLLLQDVLALQAASGGGESTRSDSGRHGFCWEIPVTVRAGLACEGVVVEVVVPVGWGGFV